MSTPVPPDADTDDVVARLRALDPAADAAPQTAALRTAVDARRTAADPGDAPAAPGQPHDELAAARARRVPSWPARAAVAAAAALVLGGGGGYALGASGEGPGVTASDAGAGATEDQAVGSAEGGDGEGLAGPAPAPEMLGDVGGIMPHGSGRTVFTAADLPATAGAASAWGFDTTAFSEQTAAAAAAALGLQGAPERTEAGSWRVGPGDGSGPTLELVPDGTVSLSYYDPTTDPWACEPVDAAGEGGCTQRDLGPVPTGDEAVTVMTDLLDAMGVDVDAHEVVVDGTDDAWTYVSAHRLVDGERTGVQWGLSLTGAGIQSLHGSLAPVVPLGEYDVVSPQEAVARLTDPRFGAVGGPVTILEDAPRTLPEVAPEAAPGTGLEDSGQSSPAAPGSSSSSGALDAPEQSVTGTPGPAQLPPAPGPGTRIAWPVDQVEIVDARLRVALHGQPDGAAVLVPTYELRSADGGTWTVVAVTEDHLDLGPVG